MNAGEAHSWLNLLLGIPLPAWAGTAAFTIGAILPWLAEYVVPDEWAETTFRLSLYGIAVVTGPAAALSIWHDYAALTLGLAASLAAQLAREVAARRWPLLSPRQVRQGGGG